MSALRLVTSPEVGSGRMSAREAAEFLGISESALSDRRRRGCGPAWYRHEGRITYDMSALEEFAAERNIQPTGDEPDTVEACISREVSTRARITRGREYVLTDFEPEILRDDLTANEVADYFNISRSTLMVLTRRHAVELSQVGFQPGVRARPAIYSRRAIMHIALILRPRTSNRANEIAAALGVPRGWGGNVGVRIPSEQRVAKCRRLLQWACEIAEGIQQEDPGDMWSELSDLSKRQLQELVVALGSLVPLDQPNLRRWLSEMGSRFTTDAEDSSAMGLALLIPEPKKMAARA